MRTKKLKQHTWEEFADLTAIAKRHYPVDHMMKTPGPNYRVTAKKYADTYGTTYEQAQKRLAEATNLLGILTPESGKHSQEAEVWLVQQNGTTAELPDNVIFKLSPTVKPLEQR